MSVWTGTGTTLEKRTAKTYLQSNDITVVESIPSNLNRLIRTTQSRFRSLLSFGIQIALAQFRKTQTRTSRFSQDGTETQGKLGGSDAIRPTLLRVRVFVGFDLFDVNFGRTGILVVLFLVGKEYLGETDFLVPTRHGGELSRGDAGQQVGLESRKVGGFAAFATEDAVFEVNDECQVRHAAIVVAVAVEGLVAAAGGFGFVEEFVRAELWDGRVCVLIELR